MLSEKRFTWKTEKLQHSDDEVIMVIDNANKEWKGHILNIVDLLNEQEQKIQLLEKVNEDLREVNKENQLLHEENVKQCERWKKLYEIKDAEVTARVDALNEVCEYYLTEAQFKADTDPNEAVHEVINRILNTEVKW